MNTHTARTKRERPLTGLRGWLIQWQVLVHLYPNFPGSHATNNSSNIEYCDKNDTILKLSSCYLHYTSFQNVRRIDNINRYFVIRDMFRLSCLGSWYFTHMYNSRTRREVWSYKTNITPSLSTFYLVYVSSQESE